MRKEHASDPDYVSRDSSGNVYAFPIHLNQVLEDDIAILGKNHMDIIFAEADHRAGDPVAVVVLVQQEEQQDEQQEEQQEELDLPHQAPTALYNQARRVIALVSIAKDTLRSMQADFRTFGVAASILKDAVDAVCAALHTVGLACVFDGCLSASREPAQRTGRLLSGLKSVFDIAAQEEGDDRINPLKDAFYGIVRDAINAYAALPSQDGPAVLADAVGVATTSAAVVIALAKLNFVDEVVLANDNVLRNTAADMKSKMNVVA